MGAMIGLTRGSTLSVTIKLRLITVFLRLNGIVQSSSLEQVKGIPWEEEVNVCMYVTMHSLRCDDFIALSAHGYEYLFPSGDNNRRRDLKRPKHLRFCPRRLAFSMNNDNMTSLHS